VARTVYASIGTLCVMLSASSTRGDECQGKYLQQHKMDHFDFSTNAQARRDLPGYEVYSACAYNHDPSADIHLNWKIPRLEGWDPPLERLENSRESLDTNPRPVESCVWFNILGEATVAQFVGSASDQTNARNEQCPESREIAGVSLNPPPSADVDKEQRSSTKPKSTDPPLPKSEKHSEGVMPPFLTSPAVDTIADVKHIELAPLELTYRIFFPSDSSRSKETMLAFDAHLVIQIVNEQLFQSQLSYTATKYKNRPDGDPSQVTSLLIPSPLFQDYERRSEETGTTVYEFVKRFDHSLTNGPAWEQPYPDDGPTDFRRSPLSSAGTMSFVVRSDYGWQLSTANYWFFDKNGTRVASLEIPTYKPVLGPVPVTSTFQANMPASSSDLSPHTPMSGH
jgi:hypothetical protein